MRNCSRNCANIVAFPVSFFLHQFGGRIADDAGARKDPAFFHRTHGGADGGGGRVALALLAGKGRIATGSVAIRPADLIHRVERGVGKQQRIGVGIADILACQDQHTPGNEFHVFAAGDHACQPVHSRVGVAAADRFDEGGDDVVMLLAFFIVEGDAFAGRSP